VPEEPGWLSIEQLARRVGGYCWQEQRLFEVTGAWASGAGSAAARVYLSELSARHARHAALWWDRLPVRAGVDAADLVGPAGDIPVAVFTVLEGEPDPETRLAGLVGVVLPRLGDRYRTHLAEASPVSEGPVIEVLRVVLASGEREIQQGRELLAQVQRAQPADQDEFCLRIGRSFGSPEGKTPGDRPS
jgi:hypothetical protein